MDNDSNDIFDGTPDFDPSLEALRLIRESLNYTTTEDHHVVFIMGASVC